MPGCDGHRCAETPGRGNHAPRRRGGAGGPPAPARGWSAGDDERHARARGSVGASPFAARRLPGCVRKRSRVLGAGWVGRGGGARGGRGGVGDAPLRIGFRILPCHTASRRARGRRRRRGRSGSGRCGRRRGRWRGWPSAYPRPGSSRWPPPSCGRRDGAEVERRSFVPTNAPRTTGGWVCAFAGGGVRGAVCVRKPVGNERGRDTPRYPGGRAIGTRRGVTEGGFDAR